MIKTMKKNEINIESGCKYLSDSQSIKALPKNCIFDKGKVGCGGTTIAITNDEPYVIAVPYVSMILNKCQQHSNLLGVYRGVNVKDITKVYKMISSFKDIAIGQFVSASSLKNRFTDIYNELGMNDIQAKGSDINNFYHTTSIKKKIDGKVVAGYRIITPKMIIKS
jgi:hypothetical protein